MSSWRWRLHPGWGGYPTSPRRLTNHKLRWSTVVIASTQLTLAMPFKLSEVWWLKQHGDRIHGSPGVTSPLVPRKNGENHHTTIDLCGWFVSPHHLWFSIYSPDFGQISFRTSGLCEKNEPLKYDHLPSAFDNVSPTSKFGKYFDQDAITKAV